jgi:hypothetical protein
MTGIVGDNITVMDKKPQEQSMKRNTLPTKIAPTSSLATLPQVSQGGPLERKSFVLNKQSSFSQQQQELPPPPPPPIQEYHPDDYDDPSRQSSISTGSSLSVKELRKTFATKESMNANNIQGNIERRRSRSNSFDKPQYSKLSQIKEEKVKEQPTVAQSQQNIAKPSIGLKLFQSVDNIEDNNHSYDNSPSSTYSPSPHPIPENPIDKKKQEAVIDNRSQQVSFQQQQQEKPHQSSAPIFTNHSNVLSEPVSYSSQQARPVHSFSGFAMNNTSSQPSSHVRSPQQLHATSFPFHNSHDDYQNVAVDDTKTHLTSALTSFLKVIEKCQDTSAKAKQLMTNMDNGINTISSLTAANNSGGFGNSDRVDSTSVTSSSNRSNSPRHMSPTWSSRQKEKNTRSKSPSASLASVAANYHLQLRKSDPNQRIQAISNTFSPSSTIYPQNSSSSNQHIHSFQALAQSHSLYGGGGGGGMSSNHSEFGQYGGSSSILSPSSRFSNSSPQRMRGSSGNSTIGSVGNNNRSVSPRIRYSIHPGKLSKEKSPITYSFGGPVKKK